MAGVVAARICAELLRLLDAKGLPGDDILAELPDLTREILSRPRARISWAEFRTFMRGVEQLVGGREALERLGEEHATKPVAPWFPAVARSVLRPRDLYRVGARLYGRGLFWNVVCRFESLPGDRIRETLEITPPDADCPQLFHLVLGALRSGPRFLGLPDAVVQMELQPGRASYLIHCPRSPTLIQRLRRRLGLSTGALWRVLDELTLQQHELIAAYAELEDAHAALKAECAERELTEQRLRQAQKLEAVGRLAAGIAHDFNNLLMVILGYAESAGERVRDDKLARSDLASVTMAAQRAAELTGGLLAFSRMQPMNPVVLDLNRVVADLEGMLRRAIDDPIEVETRFGEGLAGVLADRNQIEQLILNLVLNARDAISREGRIVVETADVRVKGVVPDSLSEIPPGRYATLSVTDDGCGMDEETLERMFEPFFTTKPLGSGTGLGLSTAYGIVQRSHGHIAVSSKPGAGTQIRIYLPARAPAPEAVAPGPDAPPPAGGSETVLLAEDDDAVRQLMRRALQDSGYTVLEARDGESAFALASRTPQRIDLLVTDVRMPRAGGPALADRMRRSDPSLRVLFVSGCADPGFAESLGPGADLIEKPFRPDRLRHKIRSLLDAPRQTGSG